MARSDINAMEVNTIIETKNAELFEHVYPLKTHVVMFTNYLVLFKFQIH